jgi:hypothetical protein
MHIAESLTNPSGSASEVVTYLNWLGRGSFSLGFAGNYRLMPHAGVGVPSASSPQQQCLWFKMSGVCKVYTPESHPLCRFAFLPFYKSSSLNQKALRVKFPSETGIFVTLTGLSPHVSQPAALVFVIARRMRTLLHVLPTGFATIEVEERIEVQPQAEPRTREAIRLRSERFRNPKTGPFEQFTFARWRPYPHYPQ